MVEQRLIVLLVGGAYGRRHSVPVLLLVLLLVLMPRLLLLRLMLLQLRRGLLLWLYLLQKPACRHLRRRMKAHPFGASQHTPAAEIQRRLTQEAVSSFRCAEHVPAPHDRSAACPNLEGGVP